jgi:hypothetical protein
LSNDNTRLATHHNIDLNISELERLFKKPRGGKRQDSLDHAPKTKKQLPIILLEFHRANNIAIMLARIKLTYPEISAAIMDVNDHQLTIDNLTALRQYIPTTDEIKLVENYNGDVDRLGNAEKYFGAVSRGRAIKVETLLTICFMAGVDNHKIIGIPRLADRIDCMIFRRRFQYDLQELLPVTELSVRDCICGVLMLSLL